MDDFDRARAASLKRQNSSSGSAEYSDNVLPVFENSHAPVSTDISKTQIQQNIIDLQEARERLERGLYASDQPASYNTTRVLKLKNVVRDYGLNNSPLVRLILGQPTRKLPALAVVHCSHIASNTKKMVLISQNLFMVHEDFESWVKARSVVMEHQILGFLNQYLENENFKPV